MAPPKTFDNRPVPVKINKLSSFEYRQCHVKNLLMCHVSVVIKFVMTNRLFLGRYVLQVLTANSLAT